MDYSGLRWFILDSTGITVYISAFPLIYTLYTTLSALTEYYKYYKYDKVPCSSLCPLLHGAAQWRDLTLLGGGYTELTVLSLYGTQRYSLYSLYPQYSQYYLYCLYLLHGEYSTLILPYPLEAYSGATHNLTHLTQLPQLNPLNTLTAITAIPLWWYTVA